MLIDFDLVKDRLNVEKHGVSLSLSAALEWDRALFWLDDRRDYGELRVLALVPKFETLYFIAFVDRGSLRRVISLRRANRREAKHYVKAIEKSSDTDPECS